MTVSTFSSREFNQDVDAAKKAARQGPVFITDQGKPSPVLLSIEEYPRITATRESLADRLATPNESIDFEPPRLDSGLWRPADFF
jgi:prevent-host-death family protein